MITHIIRETKNMDIVEDITLMNPPSNPGTYSWHNPVTVRNGFRQPKTSKHKFQRRKK